MKALIFSTAVLLAGCVSSPETGSQHQTYVKPELVMLTADQAARRGIEITHAPRTDRVVPQEWDALDAGSVVVPGDVKVYSLNRAADPFDPDLLHEEHVVYRRESGPRWQLDAPTTQKILVGPRVTDGRQELQPLHDQELASYLADQRRASEANQKAISALFQAVEALSRQQQAIVRQSVREPSSPAASPATAAAEPDPSPVATAPTDSASAIP
jgi:hypothetical protein